MPDIPVLKGERIVLRETRESDIDDQVQFGRPLEFAHMCGGDRHKTVEFPPRKEWEDWYRSNLQHSENAVRWMIEFERKCIGGTSLHDISFTDQSARLGIGMWVTDCFSRGIGSEACRLVLGYAFDVLKLHRVDLRVLDYNKRAIRCYQKCGFQADGTLRESAFIEGAFHSDIVMSILEPEYRRL